MTTCPDCRRPVSPGDPLDFAACAAAWTFDPHCAGLAEGRRRLEDARLLAVARSLPPGVLDLVTACPAAFASMAKVAAFGAEKHPGGGLGPDGRQTVEDHLEALLSHDRRAWEYDGQCGVVLAMDPETGEPHATHAAMRAVYAVEVAARGKP